MSVSVYPAVVIGAGPYGLATTAHLRAAGLEPKVFGDPMSFWDQQMPMGMLLRSAWDASHIADPHGTLTLDAYGADRGRPVPYPVPVEEFVGYGRWYQNRVAPDLDRRRVTSVEPDSAGFRLTTEDGEEIRSRRVIFATGIARYAHTPRVLAHLPEAVATHTVNEHDLSRFRDKKVLVVGSGQSGLESAALMAESGAHVEVVGHAPRLHFLKSARFRASLGPIRRFVYPPEDVGPPGLNQIVSRPHLFRLFPGKLRARMARRAIRPAGANWLITRLAGIPIALGHEVSAAQVVEGKVHASITDGTTRVVDHVLVATGYKVDIRRDPTLSEGLLRAVEQINGYPRLSQGLVSSVDGLYWVGAPAAESWGPLLRFVSGTGFASRSVAASVVASLASRPGSAGLRAPRTAIA
ncbi:MAG: NAD(P)-binding domain-containing protein [Chloroflexota bacterium]